jgi:hypothetical protein
MLRRKRHSSEEGGFGMGGRGEVGRPEVKRREGLSFRREVGHGREGNERPSLSVWLDWTRPSRPCRPRVQRR